MISSGGSNTELVKVVGRTSLYFGEIYTIMVNLVLIFSVATTMIKFHRYRVLDKHEDDMKNQFYADFFFHCFFLVGFTVCWILTLLLPRSIMRMSYKAIDNQSDSKIMQYKIIIIVNSIIFLIYWVIGVFYQ